MAVGELEMLAARSKKWPTRMPLFTRYVGRRGTCFPICLTVEHINGD